MKSLSLMNVIPAKAGIQARLSRLYARLLGILSFWSMLSILGMLSVMILTETAHAVNISGQNEIRYRRGRTPGFFGATPTGTFENSLEINAAYQDFRFYLRQRYLLPSEFGVRQTGLNAFDKKFIEYSADNITVRGGDFYRNWGRGLLFGTTEQIDINYDSGLEGLLLEGWMGDWEGAAFRGMDVDANGSTLEAAEGAWISYRTPFQTRLGVSGVYLEQTDLHPTIDRRGFEAEVDAGAVNFYTAYTYDRPGDPTLFPTPQPVNPHGYYSALSWFGGRWGVLLDYKNYRLLTDGSGDQPLAFLQYAPTVVPEATMFLLDRKIRRDRYDDNVGAQLDLSYNPADWRFHLNINQGSERQGIERLLPEYPGNLTRYRGALAGFELNPLSADRILMDVGYKENTEVFPPAREWTFATYSRGARALYEHYLTTRLTAGVELEAASFNEFTHFLDTLLIQKFYREDYLRLSLSYAPQLTISGSVERSGDRRETGGNLGKYRRYWPAGELAWNFLERHQVRLFYGHERGGLRCSGGICRFVNPFEGVKITLTSMF